MKKTISISIIFAAIAIALFSSYISYAQPYGKGKYGTDVPYGSMTSLSISTDGNINIPITPTDEGVLAEGVSSVTVTSTDVVGYKLYIRALGNTDMNNLGSLIPASDNTAPGPIEINTWGYKSSSGFMAKSAGVDYLGMTLEDSLITSSTQPVSAGETTEITYGVYLDLAKPAGNYTTNIVYTAVPQTD